MKIITMLNIKLPQQLSLYQHSMFILDYIKIFPFTFKSQYRIAGYFNTDFLL